MVAGVDVRREEYSSCRRLRAGTVFLRSQSLSAAMRQGVFSQHLQHVSFKLLVCVREQLRCGQSFFLALQFGSE